MNRCKIEELNLRKWMTGYFLDTTIKTEDSKSIVEIKATLKIPIKENEISVEYSNYNEVSLNLGFGFLKCVPGSYRMRIIEEKEKQYEMTLADIEKKLGYKIKLVSEK